jgi:hypothetical protein
MPTARFGNCSPKRRHRTGPPRRLASAERLAEGRAMDDSEQNARHRFALEVETLQARLQVAAIIPDRRDDDEESDHGRRASLEALTAVIDFLGAISNFAPFTGPLERLAAALMRIENGHPHAMFNARTVVGRTEGDEFDATLKGWSAGVLHLGMQASLGRDRFAKEITTKLREAGFDVQPNTVRKWRDAILNSPTKRPLPRDVSAFNAILDMVKARNLQGERAAKVALKCLKDAAEAKLKLVKS